MFSIIIENIETVTAMNFEDYQTAVGMYFSLLGAAILQKEDKRFLLLLNDSIIREVEIADGAVTVDSSCG